MLRAIVLLSFLASAHGFRRSAGARRPVFMSADRRAVVSTALRTATSAAAVLGGAAAMPAAASAAVGEGDLPESARRFSNVLKAQKAWDDLGSAVSKRGAEMNDKEWTNVGIALRGVYQVGEDMKEVGKGLDKSKKDSGAALIKAMLARIQSMDEPTKRRDVAAFMDTHRAVAKDFAAFFELLSDVPDEL